MAQENQAGPERASGDVIDRATDCLIARYRAALSDPNCKWETSRQGLRIYMDDLSEKYPEHPALERIAQFIAQQDRKAAH